MSVCLEGEITPVPKRKQERRFMELSCSHGSSCWEAGMDFRGGVDVDDAFAVGRGGEKKGAPFFLRWLSRIFPNASRQEGKRHSGRAGIG